MSNSIHDQSLGQTFGEPKIGNILMPAEGAVVMPIYVAKGFEYIPVLDFQAALRRGLLNITTTGSIGGATIENRSDQSVYIPTGAVMRTTESGQQPRMTSSPEIVPPHSTKMIHTNRCAQEYAGSTAKTELGQEDIFYAFPSAAVAAIKGQDTLWNHINSISDLLEIPSTEYQRDNLADVLKFMQSERLRYDLSRSVAQLSFIPSDLGGKEKIHGQLILCYDPSQTGGYTLFLSGFGNNQLWNENQQKTNTGIAAQTLVSTLAAQRDRINLMNEVRQDELRHFVTAFYAGDLRDPGAFRTHLPIGYGDLGIQIARMDDGTLVHYSAFSQKPR